MVSRTSHCPRSETVCCFAKMTDIDMPDAGPSAPTKVPSKAPIKSSKAGSTEAGADGKKRFEVKKVCRRGL